MKYLGQGVILEVFQVVECLEPELVLPGQLAPEQGLAVLGTELVWVLERAQVSV